MNAQPETRAAGAGGGPRPLTWSTVAEIAGHHKRALIAAHAVALLATAASVPIPLLFPILVDEVLLGEPGPAVAAMDAVLPAAWRVPLGYIVATLVATLLLRLFALGMGILQSQRFAVIAGDIIYRLRTALLERLGRGSLAEFETLGGGTVASHLTTDLGTIDGFLRNTLSRFLINVLTLAGIAGVLLWMNWKLALFILLLNPVVVYFTVLLGRHVKALKEKENSAVAAFQESLTETLDAIHQIRAANRDRSFLDRLVVAARHVRDHSVRYNWRSGAAISLSFLVFLFGFDVFRAVSMVAVVLAGLTIGQMLAVFSYLWYMMGPVQELLNSQYAYYGASGALGRLNALVFLREEPRHPHRENPFAGRATVGVEVEDLHFAYGPNRPVLQGIDLTVAPGERLGLVGASGGGKSTFVQALLGLYPANRGAIRYDGVPVERIGWDVVRDHVVTVLQHPALFNNTVRFNLTLGREGTDDRDLLRALEVAQLADDVAALDGGLDAVIGIHGARLSGGQRQRLAIARMVVADPRVAILDEATSALDLETEEALYAALLEHLRGKTVFIAAHRLSTLRWVDRVLVFENGRISEQGSHQQLLAEKGLYAELYSGIGRPAAAAGGGSHE